MATKFHLLVCKPKISACTVPAAESSDRAGKNLRASMPVLRRTGCDFLADVGQTLDRRPTSKKRLVLSGLNPRGTSYR